MTVTGVFWHVTYDCGDYYCEGVHTAGLFGSEAEAEAARDEIVAHQERFPGLRYYAPGLWKIKPIRVGEIVLDRAPT